MRGDSENPKPPFGATSAENAMILPRAMPLRFVFVEGMDVMTQPLKNAIFGIISYEKV